MSTRKRRRDQAFHDDDQMSDAAVNEPEVPNEGEAHPTEEEAAALRKQREDKEREVWEAIREAHYEAIEQLPLTLQRQLFLMRQLDEQSLNINSKLLPALQKYIKMREDMASRAQTQPGEDEDEQTSEDGPLNHETDITPLSPSTQDPPPENGQEPLGTSEGDDDGLSAKPLHESTPSSNVPGSVPPEQNQIPTQPQPQPPETTREILTHVAQMAEQLLRASQEKVNLAQANHDSVERHIRLLDQAIKEQEASLALDEAQNSTGVAIHLPELTAPEYRKKTTNQLTDDYDLDLMNVDGTVVVPEAPPEPQTKSKKKKGKDKKGKGQNAQQDSSSLTITLPATEPVSENEPLYCYCRQISFGEMIACDNESCKIEWFHLGCVGLTEPPDEESLWYCEECREEM